MTFQTKRCGSIGNSQPQSCTYHQYGSGTHQLQRAHERLRQNYKNVIHKHILQKLMRIKNQSLKTDTLKLAL